MQPQSQLHAHFPTISIHFIAVTPPSNLWLTPLPSPYGASVNCYYIRLMGGGFQVKFTLCSCSLNPPLLLFYCLVNTMLAGRL